MKNDKFNTYISRIENAIGSRIFSCYFKNKENVTENGGLACASFVSNILLTMGWIKEGHVTVSSTITDLLKSGWDYTDTPQKGDIIIWKEWKYGTHDHIGFFIDQKTAISNSELNSFPIFHSLDYYGIRPPKQFLTRQNWE
jgi:Bacteriophage peptidoglycan hydrolase.